MANDSDPTIPHVYFFSRRQMLLWMGVLPSSLIGCRRRRSQPTVALDAASQTSQAHAAALPSCVVRPEQTEGPYFVDEKLNRADIRVDPTDGSVRPGVPLRLQFNVSQISGGNCDALSGAMLDVWHCDASGVYSDARDSQFDTRGKKFLRGYQITDAKGIARFETIYPGWYEGRAVHIHFKIRADSASSRAREFTSQLYFDEAVTDQVHRQSPYNRHGHRTTLNASDFAYRRGGKQLIPVLSKDSQGYNAIFEIGLEFADDRKLS
jgi:protocatechuate 3,4-dioxygenase beta subunit